MAVIQVLSFDLLFFFVFFFWLFSLGELDASLYCLKTYQLCMPTYQLVSGAQNNKAMRKASKLDGIASSSPWWNVDGRRQGKQLLPSVIRSAEWHDKYQVQPAQRAIGTFRNVPKTNQVDGWFLSTNGLKFRKVKIRTGYLKITCLFVFVVVCFCS